MKDAVRDLDILLLERSPRDPPPPRRGTRKRKSLDDAAENAEEPEPDTKMRAIESPDGTKARLTGGTWGSLASAITAETLSSSARDSLERPSPGGVIDESDSKAAAQEKPKKKKRELVPRNVGGWVSPAFSKDIDRSWLGSDNMPKNFDLPTYVPQIGDTVLYYPAGHRKFLKVNPDVLGKKTRNITRMTLWDRAKKEKAKLEKAALAEKTKNEDSGNKASSKWWNEQWLSSIDGDLSRYPIICRVEKTHAEFPPDPYSESKIVTKDGETGGVQVTWAVQKGDQTKKRTNPSLCLAVMLRPLTPVLPPHHGADNNTAEGEQLNLPPNFYVVTFPSKVSPFLVPFAWAYRLSHSFSVGSSIRLSSKPEWRGKVKNFRSLDGSTGTSRLSDKIESVREVCDSLKSGQKPFAASLEQALSSDSQATIPITDACTVIERFEAALEASGACTDASSQTTDGTTRMMQLIRSTLPLWKEVIVESGSGKKLAMSTWELSSPETKGFVPSGPLLSISADIDAETGLVYIIDEPLRAKIECTIEDYLKETPDAAMFCELVTDEEAPSYSCAVPRSMAFNKVLRRLRIGKQTGAARCYYRNIDSLLGDISAIVDNCVLYNSPDSLVVEKALEIVPSIKRLIAQVSSRHFKEKEAREKSAEERRQAILMQCNAPALIDDENQRNGTTPRSRGSAKVEALTPYTEFLHRSWIQDTEPDKSWNSIHDSQRVTSSNELPKGVEALGNGGWIPQSGDAIFYSRSLHADFVKGHHPSLTADQCKLPRFSGEGETSNKTKSDKTQDTLETALSDNLQNRWLVGKVVWVRASFPRAPTKRDSDYRNTFEVASPVLTLGIKFNYSWASNKIHKVTWRPCAFAKEPTNAGEIASPPSAQGKRRRTLGSNEDQADADAADQSAKMVACSECDACHLKADQSFLRPAWIPLSDHVTTGDEGDCSLPYLNPDGSEPTDLLFSHPSGLPDQLISSVDRCLNLLKRRCLEGIPANHLDPKFSTENVKKGWVPSAAKIGKSLPTFDRLLAKGNSSGHEASTRGVEKVDKRALTLLAEANYLPPQWALSLSEGKNKKTNRDGIAQSLALHETLSPCPNFCLELIQTRLRNGYYRSIGSLAHDIEEAYVSSILLLLAKPASAKQGQAVSIRRIAKALSSREVISSLKAGGKKNVKKAASSKKDVASSKAEEKKVAKNNALSENEQMWVDKIDQVRKLYGMALVCATEPDCMERIFGTIPRKKTSVVGRETIPVDKMELAMREARHKLGFIYYSLQRDMCNNRPLTAAPAPSFKVRIRFSGQETNASNAQVGPSENLPSSDVGNAPVLEVDTTKSIQIDPIDYENNDTLVAFFFGKPGMVASCGRCSAYGRSAMTCRVRKNHSQPDFDWAYVFQGTGGINGLLYMLRTGQRPPEEALVANGTSQSQPLALQNGNATAAEAAAVSDDHKKPDSLALLEKAKEAVSLANKVMEEAERKSRTPARLSEQFIRSYFPIDPSDGHYNYCILCGLIGDVICCEGCPNVVHPHCVKLDKIPDEDWFCAGCRLKSGDSTVTEERETTSNSHTKDSNEDKKEGKMTSDSRTKSAIKDKKAGERPDSRNNPAASADVGPDSQKNPGASSGVYVIPPSASEWDGLNEDTDRLEGMLAELKSLRPIRPKKSPKRKSKQKNINQGGKDGPDSPIHDGPSSHIDEGDEDSSNDDSEEDVPSEPVTTRIRLGMKVKKKFGKHGSYIGTVLELPTGENPFYLVRYEDDDEEDMEEDEIRKCLIIKGTNRSKSRRSARGKEEINEVEEEPSESVKVAKERRGRSTRARSVVVSEEGEEAAMTMVKERRGRPSRTRASASAEEIESIIAAPGDEKKGRGKKRARQSNEAGGPKKRGRPANVSPPKKKRGRPRERS